MTRRTSGLWTSFARGAPLVVLLGLVGCKDERLAPTSSLLRFDPASFTFEPTFVDGQARRATVMVLNDGRASLEVQWRLPTTPLTLVDPPSTLPPGPTALTLEYLATVAGPVSRVLAVSAPEVAEVSMIIDAASKPIPDCTPSAACVTATFDLSRGACVEAVAADGASCDPKSACLDQPSCQGGRCVGTPRVCDDGNRCTIDVCNTTLGCEFLPAPPCPGDGRCQEGTCDPLTGCGLRPAVDGTTCGTLQTCRAAEVCIEGSCVTRDPPDGYVCANASPCQGQGVCVADQCVRPPAVGLFPRWSFDSAASANADAGVLAKQLHDFVMEPNGDMTLSGFFQTPVVLRANTAQARPAPNGVSRRCLLWGQRLVCADYPANPNGRVTALDLGTGASSWSFDVRTARPDFLALTSQIFLARLVVQGSDRLAALFEAYPSTAGANPNTQCRRYFLVTLDAQGRAVSGQRVVDPLLDDCNHPHPYGVVADSVGNLFIAFSPTTSQQAPLKPDQPTLLMSFTRDGVFRWKVTDPTMPGGELAVARGLLYPENGTVALLAASGRPAFSLPGALGRIVVSDARFIPAPVEGTSELRGYEAGLNTLRWTHVLPAGARFSSDQIRLASWQVPQGVRTVALTFVEDPGNNALSPVSLRALNVNDGSEAFSCPVMVGLRTPPQLFEVGAGVLGLMEGALDPEGGPSCSKCDPPFAGTSAAFRQFVVPGLGVAREPWVGTFGGPGHDHREEDPALTGGTN